VHLHSQSGGKLTYDAAIAGFVPAQAKQRTRSVGGARGSFALADGVAEGLRAGAEAARDAGFGSGAAPPAPDWPRPQAQPMGTLPAARRGRGKRFVDLQNDVVTGDIELAAREGFVSVEHLKRYTTLGMGTDQGKTGNLAGLALLAALTGRGIGETGPTTFRPPYVPVTYGLLAGRERGRLADPVRLTPMHDWHMAAGAVFEDVGQWKRARYYPRSGEDMREAVRRECLAARDRVALLDASTLGKIEVFGRDAGRFLDRIYLNHWQNLAIGRCRYGLMCREDGMVFDDGVGTRLAPDRFFLSTTTGNAGPVIDWLDEWLQTEWPEFEVFCTLLTEEWANATLVGPRAREVLSALAPRLALDPAAFPFMQMREADVAGIPARIFRVSFSGELSFEINVAADHGLILWERLIAAGMPYGITPYGTEAMHVLRAEKGYIIVGQETDGTVTPFDLGMGWIVSKAKRDFIGKRSFARADTQRADRKQLVGLLPEDPALVLPEGIQLVDPAHSGAIAARRFPVPMEGHVTSSYRSAALGRSFALALVKRGRARIGETLLAPLLSGAVARVTIAKPVFYDPEDARRDG